MTRYRPVAADKASCCGCSACLDICPTGAIAMADDRDGAAYAVIDGDKCVSCGLCLEVCAFRHDRRTGRPRAVYAAAARDRELLKGAASGGVFSVCAEAVLKSGGVVYGCRMTERTGSDLIGAAMIRVDDRSQLDLIAGSKYVQSDMGRIYRKIRSDLKAGRRVLFGGTPCQCAAVRRYLKTAHVSGEDLERLCVIDIVCHGVPGETFFKTYVQDLEKRARRPVTGIIFRDKRYGWGLKGRIDYGGEGGTKTEVLHKALSSYYQLFLEGAIYRESCYGCPYARAERTGDITACDYWGVEEEAPDCLNGSGGVIDREAGVSALIVNTEKGAQLLREAEESLLLVPTSFEKVAKGNAQLCHPTAEPPDRGTVMDLYRRNGYSAVEEWYRRRIGARRWRLLVTQNLPDPLKKKLGRLLGR